MPRGKKPLFSDSEWKNLLAALDLTPRQGEVVRLIVEGINEKGIARRLKLQQSTVRTHLRRASKQLEVSDRTELVIEVFREFRRLGR